MSDLVLQPPGTSQPAPGKSCGSCSLCCKLLGIVALGKPNGTWCKHCSPGVGCRIYSERPEECRTFICSWLASAGFGPEWKPDVCRMVVTYNSTDNEIVITCDPSVPDIWRRKGYLQQIRKWAVEGRSSGTRVIVYVGKKLTMVAPEGEFPIGELAADEAVASEFVNGRLVRAWAAKKGGENTRDAAAPNDPKPAS